MTSTARVPATEITGLFGALVKRMTPKTFGLGIHSDGLAATCGLPPLATRSVDDVVSPV